MPDEQEEQELTPRGMAVQKNWTAVLSTKEGRAVIYDIINYGNPYQRQGVVSMDPYEAQRELGRRDISLQVLEDVLLVNRKGYIVMQQEAHDFENEMRSHEQKGEDDG